MRLWMFLLLGCVMSVSSVEAKKAVVRVKHPGTLSKLVGERNKYRITDITVRGVINNDDIRFLRDICGRGAGMETTGGKVCSVNLRDVEFSKGGQPFLDGQKAYRAYVTSEHTVPDCMFFMCPVENIILPVHTDTVGHWALSRTSLRTLDFPREAYIHSNVLTDDSMLTELTLPVLSWKDRSVRRLLEGLKSLRKLVFRDVEYISGGTFERMPALEELTFSGFVGHIDGYCVNEMPRLCSIRFDGTVMSTGGSQFVKDCPELENIVFGGTVFRTCYGNAVNCPKFKGYIVMGRVVSSECPEAIPATPSASWGKADGWAEAFRQAEEWILRNKYNNEGFGFIAISKIPVIEKVAGEIGDTAMYARMEAMKESLEGTEGSTHLETLKLSFPYRRTGQCTPVIGYAYPSDSLLCRTRDYFNLDSIAGGGDDISRIKNILYWVHDHIRHDGGSPRPDCRLNAIELYEVCRRENRGLNCRFMAIMLNEMLLAEGIPARYLTCQSREWRTDPDCHVINVAWSTSLGKWVWMDPSFAAYASDENGVLLHPGEVRERLRLGLPLLLNEDANWNHKNKQTVDRYLKDYMAKNLYVISANTLNQSEPEGASAHPQGTSVSLVPDKFHFRGKYVTSDDEYFWRPPAGQAAR